VALNYQAAVNINAEFTGQRAIDQAKKGLNDLGGGAGGAKTRIEGVTSALKLLGGALAVQQTLQYAKSLVDLGDTFNDLRQKTGFAVDTLSSLKTAAELNGLEFGQLEGSLKKFNVVVGNAGAGSKTAASGFDALGISLKESNGKFKDSDKLLFEVADKFANLEDGPNKAAVAVRLFGKSGADLIPLLNQGSAAVQEYGIKFNGFTKKADDFNDALTLLKLNFDQTGVNILNEFLPTLTDIIKGFSELNKTSEGSGIIFTALSFSLKSLAAGLFAIASGAGLAKDTFLTLFGSIENDEYFRRNQARLDTLAKSLKQVNLFQEEVFGPVDNRPAKKTGSVNRSALNDDKSKAAADKLRADRERDEESLRKLNIQLDELKELKVIEQNQLSGSSKEYERNVRITKEKSQADRESGNILAENKSKYDSVTQAIRQQREELIKLQEEQSRSFGAGARGALEDYVSSATNTAEQTRNLFASAFNGIEDALVSFVKTGKLSFADLANTVSDQLIRIGVARAIAFGVTAIAGSGGPAPASANTEAAFANVNMAEKGGVMTDRGMAPLKMYSRGGIANSPQLAVFGEGRQAEAYVPLPDNRSIPVTLKGGGSSTNVGVTVNISNGSDAGGDVQSQTAQGQAIGKLIQATVKQTLINEMNPGGLLGPRS
jgi:lambda family phage tail tape measure protein